jgi:hypothetical protein
MKWLLILCLGFTGCHMMASSATPHNVKDTIARGYAVADHYAKQNVLELTPYELDIYLKTNAAIWRELAIYFDVVEVPNE